MKGALLWKRAEQLAFLLDCADFKCSEGWLNHFKACQGILLKCISGESGSVDTDRVSSWRDCLPRLLVGWSSSDAFNADESGLFYKMKPRKTTTFTSDACHEEKHSKKQISILFCCDISNTKKERPVMIGKSKRPRCFSHCQHVPVTYEANQNTWMTSSIFSPWLFKFVQKMMAKNSQVLLFVDNA